MQVGGWGFDTMYEVLNKPGKLVCDRGGRGSEKLKICVTSFLDDPLHNLMVPYSLGRREIFYLVGVRIKTK